MNKVHCSKQHDYISRELLKLQRAPESRRAELFQAFLEKYGISFKKYNYSPTPHYRVWRPDGLIVDAWPVGGDTKAMGERVR